MYRAELEERAALLQRLGHGEGPGARAAGRATWTGTFRRRRVRSTRRRWMRSSTACSMAPAPNGTRRPPRQRRNPMRARDCCPRAVGRHPRHTPAAASTRRSTTRRSRTATRRSRSWPRRRPRSTRRRPPTRRTSTPATRASWCSRRSWSRWVRTCRAWRPSAARLGGELEQAQKRMEELRKAQAQAEARAAQFRKLVTQFKALTDAGKLQVEIRENRMIVRLGDKILFDPGKTDLKPEGKDALTPGDRGAEVAAQPQLPGRRPHRQRRRSRRRSSVPTGICRRRAPWRC